MDGGSEDTCDEVLGEMTHFVGPMLQGSSQHLGTPLRMPSGGAAFGAIFAIRVLVATGLRLQVTAHRKTLTRLDAPQS